MRTHKATLLPFLLLAAFTLAPAMAQSGASRPTLGKELIIELEVPAPLHEVWRAFTTSNGLETWLAPKAVVDLRPGGDWIVSFPGGNSTGGGTVVSFVPEKELVLSALAPDQFPHVRAERTRAVFTFEPRGDATIVRLTQTGWKTGREWDDAYEYLLAGNAELMSALHRRFVAGPIDWSKLAAPPPSGAGEQK